MGRKVILKLTSKQDLCISQQIETPVKVNGLHMMKHKASFGTLCIYLSTSHFFVLWMVVNMHIHVVGGFACTHNTGFRLFAFLVSVEHTYQTQGKKNTWINRVVCTVCPSVLSSRCSYPICHLFVLVLRDSYSTIISSVHGCCSWMLKFGLGCVTPIHLDSLFLLCSSMK